MGDQKQSHETIPIPKRAEAAGCRSVLIVEDEIDVARALERVLQAAGYSVTIVDDGIVAAETLMSRPFDVILADITMPQMSGVDLLRIARAYDLDVPVILMTADPNLETAIEAVSLGALQYLVKPIANQDVLRAVERTSRLHRVADDAGLHGRFERALGTMWMAFQPIVDAAGRRVFGYEALMRTGEPSLPDPNAVLTAAERLGRLPDLGRRVRELCARGFAGVPEGPLLFVNLHARDLLDPALYAADSALSQMASRVVLEITERATLEDVKDIQARVSVLRYLGFRMAIDDLGAGYAGLSSFAAVEPEIVKLDMSLVRRVHESGVQQRLVGSVTTMCKDMDIQVIAEGVETAQEKDAVRKLGCDLLQGYLFAKPGPPFPEVRLDG